MRDDNETTSVAAPPCPVCGTPFRRVRRQRYCSSACKQVAWRTRHQADRQQPALPPGRARDHTVYQCGGCETRYLGEQWCPDCTRPCRCLGPGGACAHCGDLLTIEELLAGEVLT